MYNIFTAIKYIFCERARAHARSHIIYHFRAARGMNLSPILRPLLVLELCAPRGPRGPRSIYFSVSRPVAFRIIDKRETRVILPSSSERAITPRNCRTQASDEIRRSSRITSDFSFELMLQVGVAVKSHVGPSLCDRHCG